MFRVKFLLAADSDLDMQIVDPGKGQFCIWACGDCRVLLGGYDGNHVVAITLSPMPDGTTDIVLVHQWTNHKSWVSQALIEAPSTPTNIDWQMLAMSNWVNLTLAEVATFAGMPR